YLASAPSLNGVQVEHAEPNRLQLFFGGWRLMLAFEAFPWVEAESRELLADHPYPDRDQVAELARCRTRLTVWSEDPDPDMDHFNDWLLSIECLTDRFHGLFP